MIVFDTNEATGDRTQRLMWDIEQAGVEVSTENMEAGDVYWFAKAQDGRFSRSVGCEVKVVPDDLVASLGDGRLTDQLPRLLKDYTVAYLLLLRKSRLMVNWDTGYLQRKDPGGEWSDTRLAYHYLNAVLAKFEMAGGSVRWFHDLNEMRAWLLSSYRYFREDSHNEVTWQRRKPTRTGWQILSNPMIDFYERIVSKGGRSIGIERAAALFKEYNSPWDVAEAEADAIAGITLESGKKFGKAHARRVESWFQGEIV